MGIVTGYLSQLVTNGIKVLVGGTAVSSSNPLPVSATSNAVTSTKTFTAVSEYLALPITKGATSFSVFTTTASGSFNAVFAVQFSTDSTDGSDGAWISTSGRQQNISGGSVAALLPVMNISNSTLGILTDIPVGSIYARVVCTSFTTGPVAIVASFGIGNTSGVFVLASPIPAGTSKIGFVQASGIQYADTTTALGSSATFTSTTRDLTATTAASTFASASAAAKSVSICAVQDVAFTLQLLGSTDNFGSVSEIYRSIAATLVGSNYVAEVDNHSCAWRYFQYKIVNGASAAARTRGVSKFLAN